MACLAGPVVAAALVVRPYCRKIPGVRDSKTLSLQQRERLYEQILGRAAAVGVGAASVREINELNILRASHLAMFRALRRVAPYDHALIDGLPVRDQDLGPCTPIVDGDAYSYSIACASIVAKVTRDRLMNKLAARYPGYGWEHNVGYATRAASPRHPRAGPDAVPPPGVCAGPRVSGPAHQLRRPAGADGCAGRARPNRRPNLNSTPSPNPSWPEAIARPVPRRRPDRESSERMTYAAWLGKRGEMIAEELLTGIGAEVLCRNYRCPTGEIDLVVDHEQDLVAVEVKTRCTVDLEAPEEAVTYWKLRRIVSALSTTPRSQKMTCCSSDTGASTSSPSRWRPTAASGAASTSATPTPHERAASMSRLTRAAASGASARRERAAAQGAGACWRGLAARSRAADPRAPRARQRLGGRRAGRAGRSPPRPHRSRRSTAAAHSRRRTTT